jgi:hypothetical protein
LSVNTPSVDGTVLVAVDEVVVLAVVLPAVVLVPVALLDVAVLREVRLVVGADEGAGPGWLHPADMAAAGFSAWNQMTPVPMARTAITTRIGHR